MAIAALLQPGRSTIGSLHVVGVVAVPCRGRLPREAHGLARSARHVDSTLARAARRPDRPSRALLPATSWCSSTRLHPYAGWSGLTRHRRRAVRAGSAWRCGAPAPRSKRHRRHRFDHVVEPGDTRRNTTAGRCVVARGGARRGPHRVRRRASRTLWRRARSLGSSQGRTCSCSSAWGDQRRAPSLTGAVVSALRAHDGLRVVVAAERAERGRRRAPRGRNGRAPVPDQQVVRLPTPWCSPPGTNLFHEALARQVPTLFVPNLATRTDDQDVCTRFAAYRGLGLRWTDASGWAGGRRRTARRRLRWRLIQHPSAGSGAGRRGPSRRLNLRGWL